MKKDEPRVGATLRQTKQPSRWPDPTQALNPIQQINPLNVKIERSGSGAT